MDGWIWPLLWSEILWSTAEPQYTLSAWACSQQLTSQTHNLHNFNSFSLIEQMSSRSNVHSQQVVTCIPWSSDDCCKYHRVIYITAKQESAVGYRTWSGKGPAKTTNFQFNDHRYQPSKQHPTSDTWFCYQVLFSFCWKKVSDCLFLMCQPEHRNICCSVKSKLTHVGSATTLIYCIEIW